MFVVCTDGYIVGMLGPYLGRNNDASILSHALSNEHGARLLDVLGDQAMLVVDRGFRDALPAIEQAGLRYVHPHYQILSNLHNNRSKRDKTDY